MTFPRERLPWVGAALWLVLATPPLRHALEATMTRHMLLQIPLLALAGWWMAPALPQRAIEAFRGWNRSGITGFVLVSLVAMLWMLPRALDAALQVPWVEAAKFAGIPLLLGVPLALSWPAAGFVVRGVFLLEATATAFRLGWLYLASPQRLCANYLLDDQQRLGHILVALGVAVSVGLAWRLVWGHVDIQGDRKVIYESSHQAYL